MQMFVWLRSSFSSALMSLVISSRLVVGLSFSVVVAESAWSLSRSRAAVKLIPSSMVELVMGSGLFCSVRGSDV